MNASKQATWLFITLIALACSGWYFASTPSATPLDDKTLSTTADATIHDLKVRQYGVDGRLATYVDTPLMQHIPLNDTHTLKTPYIVIAEPNQPAWEIRSQVAISIHKGEKITLVNQVVIHQNQDKQTEESTLRTQEITYFPKKKLATTQAEVIYERSGSIVESLGMNAYLAEKRVQLLNRARGRYGPKTG